MAKALITVYPDLGILGKYVSNLLILFFKKNSVNLPVKEHIYDAKNNKGFLEAVIRNTRSRTKSLDIDKREYNKKKITEIATQLLDDDTINGAINWLNNTSVHDEDKINQILLKMRSIRDYRVHWITTESPSLTEILDKFKRYVDCEILVSNIILFFNLLGIIK